MLEIMDRSHGKVLGLRVAGTVSQAEYVPVREAMEEQIAQHGRIRVLVHLESLGAIEPMALWEDLKFGLKHMRDFERMAAVGDQPWLEPFVKVFGSVVPGPGGARTFRPGEVEAAWAWLEEGATV